jgi:hypothetical protein
MDISTDTMADTIRAAWSQIPAPPDAEMKYMAWGWGEDAARTFTGVAPVDVDLSSPGFIACTPLFDLPHRAAAAYLGTYLLGLLRGIDLQERAGMSADILTRAHVLTCLQDQAFWEQVIRAYLPQDCRDALVDLASYLAAHRNLTNMTKAEVDRVKAFARAS